MLSRRDHHTVDAAHGLSVLERLQRVSESAEIWWDSPPPDFPAWRDTLLSSAPDGRSRSRWAAQFDRFMVFDDPEHSLVRGVTTNPSLIAKSILRAPEMWASEIRRQIRTQAVPTVEGTFRAVYNEALRRSCTAMLPLWRRSEGQHGWVSGQLDPRHMFDPEWMLRQGLELARISPNLMVKVPGTKEGYGVVEELVARGISVNGTLSYTVPQFTECVRAIERGLARARRDGITVTRWRAVITHMIGRFGSNGDLLDEARARGVSLSPLEVRWAEIAVLKRIDQIIRAGRHPVKMLLSSLEVDDRSTGRLSMHLEQTAGADLAYTCKPDFIADLTVRDRELAGFDPAAFDEPVPRAVLTKLNQLPYFRQAMDPDGMRPDEFASHGAFVTTFAEVNYHTRRLIDFIACQLELAPERARAADVPALV